MIVAFPSLFRFSGSVSILILNAWLLLSVLVIIAWYSPIVRVKVRFPLSSVWAEVSKTGPELALVEVEVEVEVEVGSVALMLALVILAFVVEVVFEKYTIALAIGVVPSEVMVADT